MKQAYGPMREAASPPRLAPKAAVNDQAKESRVVARCSMLLGTNDGVRALLAGS